jgi:hypothetical protein
MGQVTGQAGDIFICHGLMVRTFLDCFSGQFPVYHRDSEGFTEPFHFFSAALSVQESPAHTKVNASVFN